MKFNQEEALKLWQATFKDATYGFDFAGQLILKTHFNCQHEFSWNVDYYDYNDPVPFIASQQVINARQQQARFIFQNKVYLVSQNPDFTYSIFNPQILSEAENPLNFDLYLMAKMQQTKSNHQLVLTLSLKKMVPMWWELFCKVYQKFCHLVLQPTNLIFNYDELNKVNISCFFEANQVLDQALMVQILKINALVELMILRFNQQNQPLWIDESEQEAAFYNFFIYYQTSDDQILAYQASQINLVNLINVFTNRVFANQAAVDLFNQHNQSENLFEIFDQLNDQKIYHYPYKHTRFESYLKNLSKK